MLPARELTQRKKSINARAVCQPWRMAVAFIKRCPGTVKESNKHHSKQQKQPRIVINSKEHNPHDQHGTC